jgi:hypothetical protein
MTFTDAAREVLDKAGRPLHYKEITEIAIEQNLLSHVGKSPEVTMGARLAATLKKGGDDNPLIRVKPGVFALRDWDEETIQQGLDIKRAPARKKASKKSDKPADSERAAKVERGAKAAPARDSDDGEDIDVDDDDDEVPTPKAAPRAVTRRADLDVVSDPQSPDEAKRAAIAASATEVFEQEEDDDQPILGAEAEEREEREDRQDRNKDDKDDKDGGRRRRRRRRRRGSRSSSEDNGSSGLPSYTATPFEEGGAQQRGPQVIELAPTDIPALDGVVGRELADAVAIILGTFDRTVGAVSLRQISETAQRRGKLSGDIQMAQSQIAAAVRADNARRGSVGLRPRFRMAGGRVGLTDWLLDGDLARFERELMQSLGRYRDAARKSFARKAAELPGHAFVELCVMLLERVGVSQLSQVKFPGASGSEAHFSGTLYQPAGLTPGLVGVGDGVHVAIVIRKDGRDLGRERVTELRGGAHHYNAASAGWMLTAGQVLSGAREEAAVTGVMPVTLIDGFAIGKLCGDHDVAVVRSTHPIAIPDVDLFEALRSS